MRGRQDKPENGFIGSVCKFLASVLFGGVVSLGVYFAVTWLNEDAFRKPVEICILWIIPLAWGILGVFFFDTMLDIAKKVIGALFEFFDWT